MNAIEARCFADNIRDTFYK